MRGHDDQSASLTDQEEDQKSGRFRDFLFPPGPPATWELDELGRPVWIKARPDADWGPWKVIVPPRPISLLAGWPTLIVGAEDWSVWRSPHLRRVLRFGPLAMPRMASHAASAPDTGNAPRARRRPRLEESERETVRFLALLTDMGGADPVEIAPFLYRIPSTARRIAPHAKKKAERWITAGRLALHQDAVLPWHQWPGGALPQRWESTRTFRAGLRTWYALYVETLRPEIQGLRESLRWAVEYVEATPKDKEVVGQRFVEIIREQLRRL